MGLSYNCHRLGVVRGVAGVRRMQVFQGFRSDHMIATNSRSNTFRTPGQSELWEFRYIVILSTFSTVRDSLKHSISLCAWVAFCDACQITVQGSTQLGEDITYANVKAHACRGCGAHLRTVCATRGRMMASLTCFTI